MKITYLNNSLFINRHNGPKIRKPGWEGTDPDSTFLHYVKTNLNKMGFSLVKVRISKDGHMFGNDNTLYLRSKRKGKGPDVMIYDSNYALRLAVDKYNAGEDVTLTIDFNIFGNQPDSKTRVEKIFQKRKANILLRM